MIDGIGIPVVANPSSAKAFLLEDQLSVEVMTITIAGLAKIEIKNIFILNSKVNSALLTKVIKYIYVINPIKKYIVINVIVSI